MNKDLHNIDNIFNSAQQEFEEEPSSDTWDKINARLDKKDTESYKRRFIGWKRAAILSLLLSTGFILYESGILKRGVGNQTGNIITEKTDTSTTTEKVNKPSNQNSSPHRNNGGSVFDIKDEMVADFKTDNAAIKKRTQFAKTVEKKPASLNKKLNATTGRDRTEIGISVPGIDEKPGDLLKDDQSLAKSKTIRRLLIQDNMLEKTIAEISNVLSPERSLIARNFPLINDNNISAAAKKIGPFKPYWSITGYISGDRANYKLDNDQQAISKIEQREDHEPSFSGGILVTHQIKKQWGLQTGLAYSNTAIGINPQKMYALQDQNGNVSYKYITSSGYAYIKPGFGLPPSPGDSLITASAQHTLQHIIIPLIIKYTITTHNRLSVAAGAGIAGNFLTSAKIETEIEDAFNRENVFINKLYGQRSFYWSMVADAELQYKLSKKLSVNLRPSFRYAISSITKNNDVETFPYSFGLGTGITYKF